MLVFGILSITNGPSYVPVPVSFADNGLLIKPAISRMILYLA